MAAELVFLAEHQRNLLDTSNKTVLLAHGTEGRILFKDILIPISPFLYSSYFLVIATKDCFKQDLEQKLCPN